MEFHLDRLWLNRNKQRIGINKAKKQGKYKGRKKKLTHEDLMIIKERLLNGVKKAKIAREFKISRATLYSYIGSWEVTVTRTITEKNMLP